jgi:hypothetical protein
MMDFTIETSLICDDVRREITNKDILIGVYSYGINVPTLPASVNLCFWMLVVPKTSGKLSIEIKIELPGAPSPALLKVEGQVTTPAHPFSMFTPQATYPVFKAGEIKLYVRPAGTERWRLTNKINVEYLPPSFTAPPTD